MSEQRIVIEAELHDDLDDNTRARVGTVLR
jgi:hypothetical protein